MNLVGERLVSATVDTTWAALNDPVILKENASTCESLEPIEQDAFFASHALSLDSPSNAG